MDTMLRLLCKFYQLKKSQLELLENALWMWFTKKDEKKCQSADRPTLNGKVHTEMKILGSS